MFSGRRFAFAAVVLTSQLLLIALAVVASVQMTMIARHGEVRVVEGNLMLLYGEIGASVLIVVFAAAVFGLQLKRLFEKRRGDR
jgi:hypothetical protein